MKLTMGHEHRKRYLIVAGEAAGQVRIGHEIHGKAHDLAVEINEPVSIGDIVLPLRIRNSQVRPVAVNRVYGDGKTLDTDDGRLGAWVQVGAANKDALDLIAAQVKENLLWTFMEEHAIDDPARKEDLRQLMRSGGYQKRLSFSRVLVDFGLRPDFSQEAAMLRALEQPLPHALRRSVRMTVRYSLDIWHQEPGCQCSTVNREMSPDLRTRLIHNVMSVDSPGRLSIMGADHIKVVNASCAYCQE